MLREESDKENKALNYESKTTQEESINGWMADKAKSKSKDQDRKRKVGQPLREISFKV